MSKLVAPHGGKGLVCALLEGAEREAELKKAAGLASGSGEPNKKKVGKISKAKLMEVVNIKMPDLNTKDPEAAARILAGTARQMGLEVEGM